MEDLMAPRKLDLAPSTNVRAGSYDPDTQQLTVEFYSAAGYYSQVPASVAEDFERASSAGRFVHDYLKNNFPWTRIG